LEIRKRFGNIEFWFDKDYSFNDNILLNGWHGVGECGFISLNHLVKELEARRIGVIVTESMPHFVTMKDGHLSYPFEIYKKDNLVIILPFFDPIKTEYIELTKAIVEWTVEEKFSQAILIGGLDNRLKDNAKLKCLYTDAFKLKHPKFDIELLDEGLYVTGPLAYTLMFFGLKNFPALTLLPYADRSRPDPMAASIAIEVINNLLEINVDVNELIEEAERIEKKIQSLIKASQNKLQTTEIDRDMYV